MFYSSGHVSTEHAQKLAQRDDLQRELSSLQVALRQTKDDTTRLEDDIVALEVTSQNLQLEMEELANKKILLSTFTMKCEKMASILREFTRRIQHREDLFK